MQTMNGNGVGRKPGALGALSGRATGFLRGLPRDWIVTASRTSVHRLVYQMLVPYLSVYTLALGATKTQLGLVNCAGMAVAAFISPYTGWIMDKVGPKKVYLAGILFLALAWFAYGIAWGWPVVIFAMICFYIGLRTSGHSCSVICGNSLPTEKRATGMSLCESLAAGLLGVVGPALGGFVVLLSGATEELSADSVRPLFFIALAGTLASYALVRFKLSDCRWSGVGPEKPKIFAGMGELFRQGRQLRKIVVISVIAQLPQGMIIPFTQPYAQDHGASPFILSCMVIGFAITPLVLGIPIGRLADRIGRKKTLFIMMPLFWLSSLLLVVARDGVAFFVAGTLQGAFFVTGVIAAAFQFEFVEPRYMTRWLGILGFFQMAVSAAVAYAAGIIWDNVAPEIVFLLPIALDLFVRIPLLLTIPETRRKAAA